MNLGNLPRKVLSMSQDKKRTHLRVDSRLIMKNPKRVAVTKLRRVLMTTVRILKNLNTKIPTPLIPTTMMKNPAFLIMIVTMSVLSCLDRLRKLKRRRRKYYLRRAKK